MINESNGYVNGMFEIHYFISDNGKFNQANKSERFFYDKKKQKIEGNSTFSCLLLPLYFAFGFQQWQISLIFSGLFEWLLFIFKIGTTVICEKIVIVYNDIDL